MSSFSVNNVKAVTSRIRLLPGDIRPIFQLRRLPITVYWLPSTARPGVGAWTARMSKLLSGPQLTPVDIKELDAILNMTRFLDDPHIYAI